MNKVIKFFLLLITIFASFLLGFDIGVSKTTDDILDAAECKSSFFWRPRKFL